MLASLLIPTAAQQREPIIDMHMHALAADAQGPPPLAMCTPVPEYPAWDPATPYGELFIAKSKKPMCVDPIWSPTTDDEVMNQTLAVMERRNIVGVLNGPAARVAAWVQANPRRFIRGLTFQVNDKDTHSPAALRFPGIPGNVDSATYGFQRVPESPNPTHDGSGPDLLLANGWILTCPPVAKLFMQLQLAASRQATDGWPSRPVGV